VSVHGRDDAVAETVLPAAVLNYVLRTQEGVILDDAAVENRFPEDTYISRNRSRSILCLPLLHQAKFIGVLYLENNLAPRVFVSGRIAILKLLASQAAISIENTSLYRNLEDREAKIRRLVDANIIGIVVGESDSEGRLVEANDAYLRIMGYDREDLISGRIRRSGRPAGMAQRNERALAELHSTGSFQPFEKGIFAKTAAAFPCLLVARDSRRAATRQTSRSCSIDRRNGAERIAWAESSSPMNRDMMGQLRLPGSRSHNRSVQQTTPARPNFRPAAAHLDEVRKRSAISCAMPSEPETSSNGSASTSRKRRRVRFNLISIRRSAR
jgi:PAS domain-containing protein